MSPAEQAARDILATIEATYQPTHNYVTVNPKSFGHLDLAFYERTARLLGCNGFRTVGDVENKTITNAPNAVLMPVLLRTMLSRDGTIMVTLYHPRITKPGLRLLLWLVGKRPGKVVDMETEFTDGSFVVTSNAAKAGALTLPPLISAEYLASGLTALGVFHRHAARVSAHLLDRPGVRARVMASQVELLASQNRMNAIKAAFRGELGGVTREELETLSMFGKGIAGQVHDAVVRQQVKRAG
jgi:hypothetical protein